MAQVMLAAMVCASSALAKDWPTWGRDASRNMVSTEKGLPATFVPGEKKPDGTGIDLATTKNVRWTARLGSQNYAAPVVADGRVFISTNDIGKPDPRYKDTVVGGAVICLDEANGKLLWQLVCRCMEETEKTKKYYHNTQQLGICAPPVVEGGRVYVVSNRAEVLCLDAKGLSDGNDGTFQDECHYTRGEDEPPVPLSTTDADIIWRFDMLKELPIFPHDANSSAVLICGDVLYVGTATGVDNDGRCPYPSGPSLIALNKHTGQRVASDDGKICSHLFHGQWSSPSLGKVGDKNLVFYGGGDGVCYAFEALETLPDKPVSLKCVWSFDCNPAEYRFRDGKPIDYWDGDVRTSERNKDDGSYIGPNEIIATPVFYKNRVYVAIGQDPSHGRGRGMLTCIDATKTGDMTRTGKIWTYDKIERSLSTVSIDGGLLYIADRHGTIHCLDADTGRCYWTYETKSEIWGSTLVADGKLFVGTRRNLCILAAGKETKLLKTVRLGTPIWATPVAANSTLFVISQNYLWAVQDSARRSLTLPSGRPTSGPSATAK